MQISKNTYQKILTEVQLSISQAQNEVTRSKVEMAWKIGETIEKSLPKERSEE